MSLPIKSIIMPETTQNQDGLYTIRGVFSDRQNAERAISAFQALGLPERDIRMTAQLEEIQREGRSEQLVPGSNDKALDGNPPAAHYDKVIRVGKTMIALHNVVDPKPVIDVFDQTGSDLNPDGSRNVRQDVFGMTAGAAITATALGTAGAVVAGPAGVVAGASAGTVVGGALGAAVGKVIEHNK